MVPCSEHFSCSPSQIDLSNVLPLYPLQKVLTKSPPTPRVLPLRASYWDQIQMPTNIHPIHQTKRALHKLPQLPTLRIGVQDGALTTISIPLVQAWRKIRNPTLARPTPRKEQPSPITKKDVKTNHHRRSMPQQLDLPLHTTMMTLRIGKEPNKIGASFQLPQLPQLPLTLATPPRKQCLWKFFQSAKSSYSSFARNSSYLTTLTLILAVWILELPMGRAHVGPTSGVSIQKGRRGEG